MSRSTEDTATPNVNTGDLVQPLGTVRKRLAKQLVVLKRRKRKKKTNS